MSDVTQLPCLGRPFRLGMLYDCRSDKLIEHIPWDEKKLQSARRREDFISSSARVIMDDSIQSKMFALTINGNLKLNLLGNLVKVSGSAGFLHNFVSSMQQARVALKYSSTTSIEELSMEKVGSIQQADVLDNSEATHVVSKVVYGADAFFVFDRHLSVDENMQEIQEKMKVLVHDMLTFSKENVPTESASAESTPTASTPTASTPTASTPTASTPTASAPTGNAQTPRIDKKEEKKIMCDFHGDIILTSNPSNYTEAVEVYGELPTLSKIQTIPKTVHLYPLAKLTNRPSQEIHSISDSVISDVGSIFESFHNIETRCNDLKNNHSCSKFPDLDHQISEFQKMLSEFKCDFVMKLSELLLKIHQAEDETKLVDFLLHINQSPFSLKEMDTYMTDKEAELKQLHLYLTTLTKEPRVQFSSSQDECSLLALTTNDDCDHVACLAFNVTLRETRYIRKLRNHIDHVEAACDDNEPNPSKEALSSLSTKYEQFYKFIKSNTDNAKLTFAVTDKIETLDRSGPMIILYADGEPEKFEVPSKPQNLHLKDVGEDYVTCSWSEPDHGARSVLSYSVLYRPSCSETWSLKSTTGREHDAVRVEGLSPYTKYHFKVIAAGIVGDSMESNMFNTTTCPPFRVSMGIQPVKVPGKPGTPKLDDANDTSINLVWSPPYNRTELVSRYDVHYRSSDTESWLFQSTHGKDPKLFIDNLTPDTLYRFKVRAIGTEGDSIESEVCEAHTDPEFVDSLNEFIVPGKPGIPCSECVTEDSIDLVWSAPEHGANSISSYDILYNSSGTEDWSSISVPIRNRRPTFCIVDLEANRKYVFKVIAINSAGRSLESDTCSVTTLPVLRPADVLMKTAICINPKVCPMIFRPRLKNRMRDFDNKLYKFYVATPTHTYHSKPKTEKVLMIVGATGAGKSTLIDGLANHVLGVEWKDNFRFAIVPEKATRSQAHSQTKTIIAYTFQSTTLSYDLTIIDTPGFGDTGGIENDKKITRQIKNFFSKQGMEGIAQLHGIGFVVQSSLARLTPTQRYVFDAVLSIFGKDIVDNIFLMTTFADASTPPVLEAVRVAQIPYKESFKFNNSAIFASNTESDSDFNSMFWKMGSQSFSRFLNAVSSVAPRSLTLTREVLKEREHLESLIPSLQEQIKIGISHLEEIQQEERILKQHKADINANKGFTYNMKVKKHRKEPLHGVYTTNCLLCSFTCHESCIYSDDKDKAKCCAMIDGYCQYCPQKCHWESHSNTPYRFIYYDGYETRTSDDLKERYDTAQSGKNKVQSMIAKNEEILLDLQGAVFLVINKVKASNERLSEIALRPNPLSDIEYIDLLIQSEEIEYRTGWKDRIKHYKKIRQQAEMFQKIPELSKIGPKNKAWWQFWK